MPMPANDGDKTSIDNLKKLSNLLFPVIYASLIALDYVSIKRRATKHASELKTHRNRNKTTTTGN